MTALAPSSLFVRLVSIYRHLALRCDVDDIILELLGRFSLEKIYVGPHDTEEYQQLVIHLLSKLTAIFNLQRLSLLGESQQVGSCPGLLVSWEVALRCIEFVLQVIGEGRESLWEARELRDRYLADFLLASLRVVNLHQHIPAGHRTKDRRDRLGRIHRSLEQVFDSYPGPKSFPLVVCKEVTQQLHLDPHSFALPQALRYQLRSLTSELYPLPDCLQRSYIESLIPQSDAPTDWVTQFLTLRDISHYVLGAMIQYEANGEVHDPRLRASCAQCRDDVLGALDNLRIPSHLSRVELVASFVAMFRVVLEDTLAAPEPDSLGPYDDDYEMDALDALCVRLGERQAVHRASDVHCQAGVSEVVTRLVLQDDPTGQLRGTPSVWATNCPECHFVGGSRLRSSGVEQTGSHVAGQQLKRLSNFGCTQCGQPVTKVREVPLLGRIWELLRPLKPDVEAINSQRHLSEQFQIRPPKLVDDRYGFPATRGHGQLDTNTYSSGSSGPSRSTGAHFPAQQYQDDASGLLPPPPIGTRHVPEPPRTATVRSESPIVRGYQTPDTGQGPDTQISRGHGASPPSTPGAPPEGWSSRRPSLAQMMQSPLSSTVETPIVQAPTPLPSRRPVSPERERSRFFKFMGKKKATTSGGAGDSNSLTSSMTDGQTLEEVHVADLYRGQSTGRGKSTKFGNINVSLSQQSTLALFWNKSLIQLWNVGVSPPTLARMIQAESTCLLAVVGKTYLAYMIGTRDQKLTLKIMNLIQPGVPEIEYYMPSNLWGRCMAIDKKEAFVVVGFERSIIRFFKTTAPEQPREDNLHILHHRRCTVCPPIETLAFSNDGLALVASTRCSRTGMIKIYSWTFPFLSSSELHRCQYQVSLHDSEDNGVSSAILRSGAGGGAGLVCITTWTQSGAPALIQPESGHRTFIKREVHGRQAGLGNRIQCAAFSPSGRDLAVVNDKGYLYQVTNLDSSPIDISRRATSRDLTTKSEAYSMAFMTIMDEEVIVLAWADSSKATAWIKKIPAGSRSSEARPATLEIGNIMATQNSVPKELPQPPVELPSTETVARRRAYS